MKKYRFALDIGTNSIGYAVVGLTEDGKTVLPDDDALLDMGVRIFSDGYTPKDKVPLNQIRREARQMRRQRDRRIQRKEKILVLNKKYGLYDADEKQSKTAEKLNPYLCRKTALDQQITPAELGRIFFHMAIRRGFQSNRKEAKDREEANIYNLIKKLEGAIVDSGARTLGEYFYLQLEKYSQTQQKNPIRFKDGFSGEIFPSREILKREFLQIKEKQASYFPQLPWDKFEEAIFVQRPLKKQERGWCAYEPGEHRAYKLQPSSHQIRLWQEIANIRFLSDNPGELGAGLEHAQMQDLFHLMNQHDQKTFSFKKIAQKYFKDQIGKINLEASKKGLESNITAVEMRKEAYFSTVWDQLTLAEQDAVIELLIEFNSYENEDDEKKLDASLAQLDLCEEQKVNIKNHSLFRSTSSNQTTRLSALAQRKFCEVFATKYLRYHEAAEEIYTHHSQKTFLKLDVLPYYGTILSTSCVGGKTQYLNKPVDPNKNPELYFGKIANPTVHIALNQVRIVINYLIGKYGKPDSISLELARDYKLNKKEKSEIEKINKKNLASKEDANTALMGNGILNPSRDDRIRWQLFKRQTCPAGLGSQCPYCGKSINVTEALRGGDWQVDHILPYSRYLDDSLNNKVLCCRECNKNKGNRTPYEWKSGTPEVYQQILERIAHYQPEKIKERFGARIPAEIEEEGFSNRQLNDTRYICRSTMEYIQHLDLPGGVINSRGAFTAQFRHLYGFNTLLGTENKTRDDHRHHAVDALVVALVDRSCFARLVKAAKRLGQDQSDIAFQKSDMEHNPFKIVAKKAGLDQIPFSRGHIQKLVDQILPTFKPQHKVSGRFFQETAMGQIKKPVLTTTTSLKEDDRDRIVSKEIQEELEVLSDQHENNFKKMISALALEHPMVYVYRDYWVTRKDIEKLEETDLQPHTDKGNYKGPVSDSLRGYLLSEVQIGRPLKEVLAEYCKRTGTKRVRYIPHGQEVYTLQAKPRPTGYALDGYAYAEIWMLPPHKNRLTHRNVPKITYQGEFVSYVEANRPGDRREQKPHPAAKKLMRLYKQDVICLQSKENPQEKIYYRVKGYSTTRNMLDLCPIHKADIGRDFWSINVIFHEYDVHVISQYLKGPV